MTHIVVDPVTRIEGHLRIEAEVENGWPFGSRPSDEAQVVSQSHGPGSMVDRGTTITLRAF